jgi:E3 SUMO-protein ligase PIAS1
MRNMPNHARGRVMGLAAPPFVHMRPPTGVPGQGRGANAHGAPFPQQYQHLDQRQIDNLMGQFISQVGAVSQGMPSNLFAPQQSQALRSQAVSRPGTPPVQPPQQSQALRSQAVSRPGTPPVQPRVQSPGLPQTAPATPLVESSDAPELQMDPNWQPTGRMRGSLVGPAYDQAIGRYLQPGGERTSQAQPPGR